MYPPKLLQSAFLDAWSTELIKFYANALQCTFPDHSNLKRWGLSGILKEAINLSIARTKRGISSSSTVILFVRPGAQIKEKHSKQELSIF